MLQKMGRRMVDSENIEIGDIVIADPSRCNPAIGYVLAREEDEITILWSDNGEVLSYSFDEALDFLSYYWTLQKI
jgi:hypothetical protein